MNDIHSKYCFYCERAYGDSPHGGKALIKTKDYIIPMAKGGRRAFHFNILYCCDRCNRLKGDMMTEEFCNYLLARIAKIKKDTEERKIYILILKKVRELILIISPVRHKMVRPMPKAFSAFRITETKKESRPSTPLWWRGFNEK